MKKLSGGKIAAAIIGGFAFLIVLWISLIVSIFVLVEVLDYLLEEDYVEYSYEEEYEEEYEYPEWDEDDEEEKDSDRKKKREEEEETDRRDDEDYYEFGNDIRDDLSYQLTFEESYRNDFSQEGANGTVTVEFVYPVITGEMVNLDAINDAIYSEVALVEEYVAEAASYMTETDEYNYMGEAYVTYMSEEILSVIYVEYGYFNGEFMESYVRCFNVDVQTGMILKNTKLLEIDDAFSVDFRKRCERQNGEIEALDYFMDQDITECLTEESSLIVFYTPLGMEVGFNYYDGWVTVTYKDYEKYQKQF